jgi:hypothetical protein
VIDAALSAAGPALDLDDVFGPRCAAPWDDLPYAGEIDAVIDTAWLLTNAQKNDMWKYFLDTVKGDPDSTALSDAQFAARTIAGHVGRGTAADKAAEMGTRANSQQAMDALAALVVADCVGVTAPSRWAGGSTTLTRAHINCLLGPWRAVIGDPLPGPLPPDQPAEPADAGPTKWTVFDVPADTGLSGVWAAASLIVEEIGGGRQVFDQTRESPSTEWNLTTGITANRSALRLVDLYRWAWPASQSRVWIDGIEVT